MRVLLTGGSGFLGGHTARALSEAGYAVRVLVRPTSDRAGLAGLEVEYAVGDLSGAGLAGACAEMDAVVHLAALTQARSAAQFQRVNGEGTGLLAEAAAAAGVARFVYGLFAGGARSGAAAGEGGRGSGGARIRRSRRSRSRPTEYPRRRAKSPRWRGPVRCGCRCCARRWCMGRATTACCRSSEWRAGAWCR